MKKYAAIISDIEQRIAEGQYRPGQKLASVRDAANRYACSTSTVIRAYAELEKRHAIYAIAQSGFYVVQMAAEPQPGRSGIIDFSSSSPDSGIFPYLDFQHCLNQAIDTYKEQLFTYGELEGLHRLRHTLASHLTNDQIFVNAKRIVVTAGIQEALEIVAKMTFPNGHAVILVEQPSYGHYLRYLEAEGVPVRGIARTADGVDLNELEEIFKSGGIKFFYTMPRHHNPIGTSYGAEERKAIAGLASRYNVYIIEDDYMADLDEGAGYAPIYADNLTSHVIYLKSFSKIIFPGLRLGAAVLPETLLKPFLAHKRYNTSLLSQAALDVYITNGMYERHKSKIRRQYAARIHALNEAVAKLDEAGILRTPCVDSGIYMQFKLPPTINLDRLLRQLADRSVQAVAGNKYYLTNWLKREKFLRISTIRVKPEQIEEGVKAIVEEAGRMRGSWRGGRP